MIDPTRPELFESTPGHGEKGDFWPAGQSLRGHEYQIRASLSPPHTQNSGLTIGQQKHYLALVYNELSGKVSRESSASLAPFQHHVFQKAPQRLATVIQQHMNSDTIQHDTSPAVDVGERSKRSRSEVSQYEIVPVKDAAPRPHKARRVNPRFLIEASPNVRNSSFTSSNEQDDIGRENMIQYRVDAREDWERWFNEAFRAVQQVSCRIIAKEWIKIIHPKKQSTHPYNGKNPRTGERGDPDLTKPSYWPRDVIHKEPDHINKEARTKLLVHLLMNTPHREVSPPGEPRSDKEINAMALKEALDQKGSEHGSELNKKFAIIEQIIHARTQLELYEDGGYASNSYLTVRNFADYTRGSRSDDDSNEPPDEALDVITGQGESNDDDVLTVTHEDVNPELMDDEPAGHADASQATCTVFKPLPKRRKKAKKGNKRKLITTTAPSESDMWISNGPGPNTNASTPAVPEYDRMIDTMMEHEPVKLPEHVYLQPNPAMSQPMQVYPVSAPWQHQAASMDGLTYFDSSYMTNAKHMPNMDQSHCMNSPYSDFMPRSAGHMPQYLSVPGQGMPYPYNRHTTYEQYMIPNGRY